MSQIQKDILFLRITDALRENDFFIIFFFSYFILDNYIIFIKNITAKNNMYYKNMVIK